MPHVFATVLTGKRGMFAEHDCPVDCQAVFEPHEVPRSLRGIEDAQGPSPDGHREEGDQRPILRRKHDEVIDRSLVTHRMRALAAKKVVTQYVAIAVLGRSLDLVPMEPRDVLGIRRRGACIHRRCVRRITIEHFGVQGIRHVCRVTKRQSGVCVRGRGTRSGPNAGPRWSRWSARERRRKAPTASARGDDEQEWSGR